jgi:hypothetical protein
MFPAPVTSSRSLASPLLGISELGGLLVSSSGFCDDMLVAILRAFRQCLDVLDWLGLVGEHRITLA